MKCPRCGKNEAFWVTGLNISLYTCDACKYDFNVNLDKMDNDSRSGKMKQKEDYIIDYQRKK
jgi:transposase-like protein